MSIDLSQLPPPEVIETISFETILAELKADFVTRWPDAAGTIDLESDPAVKLLEVAAYRELVLRARINDAARAVMLAHAGDSDLEHLAALLGVARLADEDDTRLRYRTQLALEGFSTAGPLGAYIFHALSASLQVEDVAVDSPADGQVRVVILSTEGNGAASPELLATVEAYFSAEKVRPLTDDVIVESAEIVEYTVEAILHCYPGPSSATVLDAANVALSTYQAEHRRLGHDHTLSGLDGTMHRPGVQRVDRASPAAHVVVGPRQAAHCTAVNITVGDADV